MTTRLHLVGEPAADELLTTSPFALLVGMLLDQQIPMDVAFAGPRKLSERMDEVSPSAIAAMDPADFIEVCAQTPAVHRFPKSMGNRVHELSVAIVEQYDGKAEAIWTCDEPTGAQVLKRLKALPGFGDQKAKIFLALLGKQYGLNTTGWREAAGDYGKDEVRMSIADVYDDESMQAVRAWKQERKAAAKAAKAAKAEQA